MESYHISRRIILKSSEGNYISKRKRSITFLNGFRSLLWQIEKKMNIRKFLSTILSLLIVVPSIFVLIAAFIVLKIYRVCKKQWILHKTTSSWEVIDISTETIINSTCEKNNTLTFVVSLQGKVDFTTARNGIQEYIRNCEEINGKHTLRRILCKINGFYVWKPLDRFDLSNHVTLGNQHHQGNSLCQRNIQEYISDVCSEQLPLDLPPWQVVVAQGWGEHEEELSWIIFRAHKILVQELPLKDLTSSFPNPWSSTTDTRPLHILSAPSVLLNLVYVFKEALIVFMKNLTFYIYGKLKKILVLILRPKIFITWFVLVFEVSTINLWKLVSLTRNGFSILENVPPFTAILRLVILYITVMLVIFIIVLYNLPNFVQSLISLMLRYVGIKIDAIILLQQAVTEIYWILRAIISIPRLLMVELYESQTVSPLHPWHVKRDITWERNIVSWSDEIPLSAAKEMRAATGACIPSVVLAALGRGIRDLIKHSGITPSTKLRCSFPVYIPHRSKIYGLLPFALPTSAPSAQIAFHESLKSMEDLRKYPERYLASVWLRKYLPHFIPVRLFKRITKHLTATHPILVTYLIGPEESTDLWGRPMKTCFLWRPPQQNAVLSVCVTSYCNKISIGVMANGWSVPEGRSLPRLFSLHFSEILHEHGILIERKQEIRRHSRGINLQMDGSFLNQSVDSPTRGRNSLSRIVIRKKSTHKMTGVIKTDKSPFVNS